MIRHRFALAFAIVVASMSMIGFQLMGYNREARSIYIIGEDGNWLVEWRGMNVESLGIGIALWIIGIVFMSICIKRKWIFKENSPNQSVT